MKTPIKSLVLRAAAATILVSAVFGTANAGVFIRTRLVVAPVVVAPVVVAPVIVAAPVVVAPLVVAPAAVYVPTCRFVAVPVTNAFTGWTMVVRRRVCN